MKIGELAKAAHVEAETIRYYERIGLLPAPSRSPNGYRAYAGGHLERLAFIRHCRALDIALVDVAQLLRFVDDPTTDCAEVDALIDTQLTVSARVSTPCKCSSANSSPCATSAVPPIVRRNAASCMSSRRRRGGMSVCATMSMRNDLRFGGGVTTMWGASAPVRSWSRYAPSANRLGLKSSPMHRWLAIFFLLLVPLQFASAGLEAYCLESAGFATSHGDHHPHTCQVDEGDEKG